MDILHTFFLHFSLWINKKKIIGQRESQYFFVAPWVTGSRFWLGCLTARLPIFLDLPGS